MQRRNFLKACVAALLAPAALVKAEETPKVVVTDDGWNPNPGPGLLCDCRTLSKQELREILERTAKLPQPDTSKLNDLFVSPEAMEEMRLWGCDQMDEQTRREILLARDHGIVSEAAVQKVFGIGEPRRAGFYGWEEHNVDLSLAMMDREAAKRILKADFQ